MEVVRHILYRYSTHILWYIYAGQTYTGCPDKLFTLFYKQFLGLWCTNSPLIEGVSHYHQCRSWGRNKCFHCSLWKQLRQFWKCSYYSWYSYLFFIVMVRLLPCHFFASVNSFLVFNLVILGCTFLARACGVPVGRCSGGRLATALVATKKTLFFFLFFSFPVVYFSHRRSAWIKILI